MHLKIDEENSLKATLTQESAQLMGLDVGTKVLALTKATAVEIAQQAVQQDYGNILRGTVVRTSRADRGGEVTPETCGRYVPCGVFAPPSRLTCRGYR